MERVFDRGVKRQVLRVVLSQDFARRKVRIVAGACRAPVSDSRAPGSNQSGASQLGTQANAGHRWQPSRRPLSPPGPCACNTAWFFVVSFQPSAADSIGIVNTPLTQQCISNIDIPPNTPLAVQVDESVRSGGDDP